VLLRGFSKDRNDRPDSGAGRAPPPRLVPSLPLLRATRQSAFHTRTTKIYPTTVRGCCLTAAGWHTLPGESRVTLPGRPPSPAAPDRNPILTPACSTPAIPTPSLRSEVRVSSRTVACVPLVVVLPQEERIPSMRVRSLLLLLSFAVLALTSGCHHHCCRGGCAPCGPCVPSCCGYSPVESPVPPLAAPAIPPHVPVVGPR
jgi:hypothetical protein